MLLFRYFLPLTNNQTISRNLCLFLWMIEITDIKWAEKHDSGTIYIR